MRKFWQFFQYNNTVPITLFVLFGVTGAAFAASPEARQAIYSSTDTVQSVDNTYIVSADLGVRDFQLHITGVTEDETGYYVTYAYKTINVVDYVWQEQDVDKEMQVSKKEVQGKDLGLFVAKQLGEEISHELAYLTEVQNKEREKGATPKVVATLYSGLIGKMFDPTQKTFPGYEPVVEEQPVDSGVSGSIAGPGESHIALPPTPSSSDIQAMVAAAVASALAEQSPAGTVAGTSTPGTIPLTNPEAPTTSINGGNPARIAMGTTYLDLGATVSDDVDTNLGIHTFVNGVEMDLVSIDTSTAATYTITYKATDADGNTGEATRTVEVYDPTPPPPPEDEEDTSTSTPPVVEPTPTSTPESTPPEATSTQPEPASIPSDAATSTSTSTPQ